MNFLNLKHALQEQMSKMDGFTWFVSKAEKDDMWETYLESYRPEDNPIYRVRREYDCSCCRQFIKAAGGILAIIDGELVSIWDVDVEEGFQIVCDAMSNLVKEAGIDNLYRHYERTVGTDRSFGKEEGKEVVEWNHFYAPIPPFAYMSKQNIPSFLSDVQGTYTVFKRGVEELSLEAAETVLELINDNSIYRGEEHKAKVQGFISIKKLYDAAENKELFLWENVAEHSHSLRFKNTVIGELVKSISEGTELDQAVKSYENMVAPANYKRPKKIVTAGMIKKAQARVEELGCEPSLYRRHAVMDDISINNVLFADRAMKEEKGVFEELIASAPDKSPHPKNATDINVEEFISLILPQSHTIEMMFENKHINNLMTLIAPVHPEAPSILQWDNNFSFTYNGGTADSMKERVKKAGGNVEGVLRFSLQWNEDNNNRSDLDAHCIEPRNNTIYYPKKGQVQPSSGMLDVDVVNPGKLVAVENIAHTNTEKMPNGDYVYLVHCFSKGSGDGGFDAEIEFDGKIYSYHYSQSVRQDQKVKVATVTKSVEGFTIKHHLDHSTSSKEVWGIPTQKFHKVRMAMLSPNHWDDNAAGNKHWFFILEDCKNPDKVRGFYNEFLRQDLMPERKVFEMLGEKMKAEYSPNQLSGLGFSSTQRNSVMCRVEGEQKRLFNIKF